MPRIAVIGAGPAGMMAALFAADAGSEVILLDSNEHPGRKILVTGAGRCNLTHADPAAVRYACEDPVWLNTILQGYPQEELLRFLDSLGIPAFSTFDGWYYPVSESAHAVVDALSTALDSRKVTRRLQKMVTGIRPVHPGFEVGLHQERLAVDRVIVACGGKAYPQLGSDGNLYSVLNALGHNLRPVYPALAPVTADMHALQGLRGIRLDAEVTLLQAGRRLGTTLGNIIFTEWGVNGPGVMDLSYLVHRYGVKSLSLEINFLQRYQDRIRGSLQDGTPMGLPVRILLQSVLPPKLVQFLLDHLGIPSGSPVSSLSPAQVDGLLQLSCAFPLQVTGTRGFQYSQVSCGGIPAGEVDPERMESRLLSNLFFAGEVLDVVGPCGGYNLHFAFTSGAIAGRSAGGGI